MFTQEQLDDLLYSAEYAEYIMEHGDQPCYNGDMLIGLMEDGYLWSEFIESLEESIAVAAY